MSRVHQSDTAPELEVRRILHRLGYRYRLHRRGLPGTPDIVFTSRKKVIFVHGCFWHRHEGCRHSTTPKTRVAFWKDKFEKNVERDSRNLRSLRQLGWKPLVIWQCQTEDAQRLGRRLARFLG